MSTKLEKYFKEKRDLLDVEYPDDNAIWSKIESKRESDNPGIIKLQTSNSIQSRFWKIAAIITITISLGYITFDAINGNTGSDKVSLSSLNTDLGKMEYDYIQTVKYKQKEVKSINLPDNEIINSLLEDLELQDELYDETIKDMVELGDNHMVVNTIFKIYERKIDLLERIIIETNKTENYEKSLESNI